jgi:hypothetical protein
MECCCNVESNLSDRQPATEGQSLLIMLAVSKLVVCRWPTNPTLDVAYIIWFALSLYKSLKVRQDDFIDTIESTHPRQHWV